MMKFAAALSLLAVPLVSASNYPRIPRELPSGTSRIAVDDTGDLIAYDDAGTNLGVLPPSSDTPAIKRQVGSCVALSADDAQKRECNITDQALQMTYLLLIVPGWETLKSTAQSNWGDGGWNIVTNPEEYRDYPANLCVSPDTVRLTQSGKCIPFTGFYSDSWSQILTV
jgi:hypothetical protein